MKYQAGIYFDNNDVVLTNVTKNTLYNSPEPDAAFSYKHACADTGKVYDFEYTGNTPDDATYSWAFADGTPSTSTSENPSGITFSSTGYKLVNLTINRNGCTALVSDTILISSVLVGSDSVRICQSGDGGLIIDLDSLASYLDDGACVGECNFEPARLAFAEEKNLVSSMSIKVQPNPANTWCMIDLTGISGDNISVELLNYTGSSVKEIYEGRADNSSLQLKLQTGDLKAGLYFIKTSCGDQLKVIKLIIQH